MTVPNLRKIANDFYDISLSEIQVLLHSKVNEERFLALIILVKHYQQAQQSQKETLYQFYVTNRQYVNNWNLVDASAHLIIGAHLWDRDRDVLRVLAQSDILWDRRIAIVSTWYFIKNNDIKSTFQIARLLRHDTHDLIHKAVGWMLREAGKKNQAELVTFLDQYGSDMPRTMLPCNVSINMTLNSSFYPTIF